MCVLAKLYIGNESLFELQPKEHGTKKERLFHLFINQPNKSKAFYRNELFASTYRGTGYEVLRRELADDILKFFGPPRLKASDGKTSQWAEYLFVIRVAGIRNLMNSRMIAPRLIPKLIEYHRRIAEKLVLISELLYLTTLGLNVAGINSDSKKVEYFLQKRQELSILVQLESDYLDIRTRLESYIARTKNTEKSSIQEFAEKVLSFEMKIPEQYRDHFVIRVLRLKVFISDAKKDFVKIRKYALTLWNARNELQSVNADAIAANYLVYASANLDDEASVNEWSVTALKYVRNGSYNWFTLQEVLIGFRFLRFELDLAIELFISVISSEHFSKLPRSRKDIWVAYQSYLLFFGKVGIWSFGFNDDQRLRKSETDNWSLEVHRDKAGVNVSLIILEILNNLGDDRFDLVIDQYDSLARYKSRYLRDSENERPKIFIGMLLKVIQLDFNPFEIEKKTRKQLEKLKTMNPNLNMNMGGNEIIRYEVLWDWILKKLRESSLLPKPKA